MALHLWKTKIKPSRKLQTIRY